MEINKTNDKFFEMTYNPFSLIGKTILVTGASSGIGRSTAIECSQMGATLCITGRNEERLAETLSQLKGKGHIAHIADLTNEEQIECLVNSIPQIDGVVHSAGVIEGLVPCTFIESSELLDLLSSNLLSIINLNSTLVQNSKLKSMSSVVHISSINAHYPSIGTGKYSITKSALLSYSKTLATELIIKRIRVNSILPAMIETDIVKGITAADSFYDKYKERYSFGYGKPEYVAWMCVYLLSDAAQWITGEEYNLYGGALLKWR